MSSDEEDLLFATARKRRNVGNVGCIPTFIKILIGRLFITAKEISEDDSKFQTSKTTFKDLALIVDPAIQKQNTDMRECISAEERIMIFSHWIHIYCSSFILSKRRTYHWINYRIYYKSHMEFFKRTIYDVTN